MVNRQPVIYASMTAIFIGVLNAVKVTFSILVVSPNRLTR
jgi:hypothetical protein